MALPRCAKPFARNSPARYSAKAGICPSPSTVLNPTERLSISSARAEMSGGTAASLPAAAASGMKHKKMAARRRPEIMDDMGQVPSEQVPSFCCRVRALRKRGVT